MSAFITRHSRSLIVGLSCAGLATGAGAIATAGASTGHATGHAARGDHSGPPPGPPPLAGLTGQAVHGQVVVPTKTGFATVTFDRGVVKSVDGQQLEITEGTKTNTYQTVTVTVPANAIVRNDGSKSSLADVSAGEHVTVIQGPEKTCVLAGTGAPGARPQGRGAPGRGGPQGQGGPQGGQAGPQAQGGQGGQGGQGQGGPAGNHRG